jgi:hypothetical protein
MRGQHLLAGLLVMGLAGPASAYNVYFGNFHAHTELSDGIGTPEEAYAYARDVADIDILGLTEHTHLLTQSEWVYLNDVADQYTTPGVFVALPGQEFGKLNDFGHIGIFDVPYRNPNATTNLPATYNFILTYGGIGSFHHPNPSYGTWFDSLAFYPDFEEAMHGIEMRNGRRADDYEPEVIFALNQGWRLAFFANQDNHEGQWGDQPNPNDGYAIYLTGVLADTLTKEAILEALHRRRFYAAEVDPPSDRINLWFWLNDSIMGSRVETPGPVVISAHAEALNGVSLFNRVDLFRDGVIVDSQILVDTVIDYQYEESIGEGESHYYFVRVRQVDGDYAWSAPIWVQQVGSSGAPGGQPKAQLRLLPSAPNPFFPRTEIRYESPGVLAGPLRLTIHDVLGRRVRDFGLVPATTGIHRIPWDGRNDAGQDLPSGIYLVRLASAHGEVHAQRVLLTR